MTDKTVAPNTESTIRGVRRGFWWGASSVVTGILAFFVGALSIPLIAFAMVAGLKGRKMAKAENDQTAEFLAILGLTLGTIGTAFIVIGIIWAILVVTGVAAFPFEMPE